MALKQKTQTLINTGNEVQPGGAPFYANDILKIQENALADSINFFEALRRRLPDFLYYDGPFNPPIKKYEPGLVLAGCEYDNSDPTNPTISEGFILSGGSICYYPGATFSNPTGQVLFVFLYKGPRNVTNRVFNDGNSKELFESFSVVTETTTIGTNGVTPPPLASATDEVVFLALSDNNSEVLETYHTIEGALGIPGINKRQEKNVFLDVTNLRPGVTIPTSSNTLNYLKMRNDPAGYMELVGMVTIDFAQLSGSEPLLFQIPQTTVNINGKIPFRAEYITNPGSEIRLSINDDDEVRAYASDPSFPTTGSATIYINAKVWGRNIAPNDDYDYNASFLNITP